MTQAPTPARLALRNVRKTFGPNVALRGLDLDIRAGTTHAVVGQNGSGKSTLVKILAGVYHPDSGSTIAVEGTPLAVPIRPRDLRQCGVSFVHQTLGLVENKSVTENIAVGDFTLTRGRRIDWHAETVAAGELLRSIDADIDPRATVASLGPADRSKVAIARAIRPQGQRQGVLVLDEPSRALPPAALREFHGVIRRLVERGTSVLLISHNLEEVLEVADEVSVLRDGELSAQSVGTSTVTESELASLMLGHTLPAPRSARARTATAAGRVRVNGLRRGSTSFPDLTLSAGEIVGLTGLAGGAWEHLPYLLGGAVPADSGTLLIDDASTPLRGLRPRAAVKAGVALVPEERLGSGLAATRTVTENIALPWLSGPERKTFLSRRRAQAAVVPLLEQLDVRPRDPDFVVGQMSGGNQQKVLLAKWMRRSPRLLLLHEPTQAVDVGARDAILRAVRQVADDGVCVLYASTQPTDLIEICDRVLVYRQDRFSEVRELTQDAILDAVYTDTKARKAGKAS